MVAGIIEKEEDDSVINQEEMSTALTQAADLEEVETNRRGVCNCEKAVISEEGSDSDVESDRLQYPAEEMSTSPNKVGGVEEMESQRRASDGDEAVSASVEGKEQEGPNTRRLESGCVAKGDPYAAVDTNGSCQDSEKEEGVGREEMANIAEVEGLDGVEKEKIAEVAALKDGGGGVVDIKAKDKGKVVVTSASQAVFAGVEAQVQLKELVEDLVGNSITLLDPVVFVDEHSLEQQGETVVMEDVITGEEELPNLAGFVDPVVVLSRAEVSEMVETLSEDEDVDSNQGEDEDECTTTAKVEQISMDKHALDEVRDGYFQVEAEVAEVVEGVQEEPDIHSKELEIDIKGCDGSFKVGAEAEEVDKEDGVREKSDGEEKEEEVSALPSLGADVDCEGFTQTVEHGMGVECETHPAGLLFEDGVGSGVQVTSFGMKVVAHPATELQGSPIRRSGLASSAEVTVKPLIVARRTSAARSLSTNSGTFFGGLAVKEEEKEDKVDVQEEDDEGMAALDPYGGVQIGRESSNPMAVKFGKAVSARSLLFHAAKGKVAANGDSVYSSFHEEVNAGRGLARTTVDIFKGNDESPGYYFGRGKQEDSSDNDSAGGWLENEEDDDDEEVVLPAVLLHSDSFDQDDDFEASSSFEDLQNQLLSASEDRSSFAKVTLARQTPVKDKYEIHSNATVMPSFLDMEGTSSRSPDEVVSWQMLRGSALSPPLQESFIPVRSKLDKKPRLYETIAQEMGHKPEGWNKASRRRHPSSVSGDSFIKSTILEEVPWVSPATKGWQELGEQAVVYAYHGLMGAKSAGQQMLQQVLEQLRTTGGVMEAKSLGQKKLQQALERLRATHGITEAQSVGQQTLRQVLEGLRAVGARAPGLSADVVSKTSRLVADAQNANWREMGEKGVQYASYGLQEVKTQGQQTIQHVWEGLKAQKEAAVAGLERRDWHTTTIGIANHVKSAVERAELRKRGTVGLQYAYQGLQQAKTVGYHGLNQAKAVGYQGLQQAKNVGKENLVRAVETLSTRSQGLGIRPETITAGLATHNLKARGEEMAQLVCQEWTDLYVRTRQRLADPYDMPIEGNEADLKTGNCKKGSYSRPEKEGALMAAIIAVLLIIIVFVVLFIVLCQPSGKAQLPFAHEELLDGTSGTERMCRCPCNMKS